MREQFRIAEGEELGFTDPAPRGHSLEFRINGEDAGPRLPAGPRHRHDASSPPLGPGVRVDTGVVPGDVIGGAFDSPARQADRHRRDPRSRRCERAARALDEMQVEGMATLMPFHRKVVRDKAFTTEPFTVHNRWIETEFDNDIPPFTGGAEAADEAGPRETVVVEVGGKRLEVVLPAGLGRRRRRPPPPAPAKPKRVGEEGRRRRGLRRHPDLARCRAPSSRSPSRTAPPSRPATSSSCSRR